MSSVTKDNVGHVINALAEFYNRMTTTGQFNPKELFDFMEPKFTEAGYRSLQQQGGVLTIVS